MTSKIASRSKIAEYAELVKFEHTIFALPFALSAMLLATEPGRWPDAPTVVWILLCMVGGRTYAMALNRLLDRRFDAKNPRTAERAIPAGRVKTAEAWLIVLASGLLFAFAAFQLPLICRLLLPLAFAILTGYSFMKRFTSACHLVLGLALGSSAIGGWLAVTGEWSWLAFMLGLAVTFWVAGFDIIYACQDVDFDRREGLHSIPAWIGTDNALALSKICHGLTWTLLAAFAWFYPYTGNFFHIALLIIGALLVFEHRLVTPQNLSRLNMAFFTVNGWISTLLFVAVLLDKALPPAGA